MLQYGYYLTIINGGFKMKEKSGKEAFLTFLRKYGYIIGLALMMVVISTIVVVSANKSKVDDNNPVNAEPVSFYSPLLSFTVAKNYNDKGLVWNSTLKQWEAHKGVCLTAAENSEVFACLDGVVADVYSNHLNGTVVVLEHNNNLKTYYSSLDENVNVKKGDKISRGSVIGKVSNSGTNELNLGNHLHFEVTENNVKVNPATYLNLETK